MMLGLLTSGIGVNLYGFSSSFWVAFSIRLFCGLTNANTALTSAVCADVTSGKQRVLAFAYLWSVWGIAGSLAGSIGGIFSEEKFQPITPWGNRFIFPCFLVGCLNFLSCLSIGLYLPETLKREESDPSVPPLNQLSDEEESDSDSAQFIQTETKSPFDVLVSGCMELFATDALRRLLCSVYCVNSFVNGAFIALLIIFYSTPTSSGGFGFSSFEIGLLVTWQSLIGLLFQIFFFKRVSTLLNSNFLFYSISLLLYLIGCILFPLSAFPNRYSDSKTTFYMTILFSMFSTLPISIAYMIALPVLGSMQSNISPPELQGLSMGILQSLSSFFRSFGPVIVGFILDFLSKYHLASVTFLFPFCFYVLCSFLISRMTKEERLRAEISEKIS